jgi:hypothetical protein
VPDRAELDGLRGELLTFGVAIEHVVHGMGVVVPLFPVAPVFLGNLVTLVAGGFALLKAAQLLFLVDG